MRVFHAGVQGVARPLPTDITDPIPLAHKLIRLGHFHEPLAIHLARRCLAVIITVLLKLINKIILGIIRIIIYHLLDPHFLTLLLRRQIRRAATFKCQLLRLIESFPTSAHVRWLPADLLILLVLLLWLLATIDLIILE